MEDHIPIRPDGSLLFGTQTSMWSSKKTTILLHCIASWMKEFAFRIHVFENQTNDPIVFEYYLQKEEILCDMSLRLTTLLIPSAHKKAVINLSSRFCSCWLKWQWHLTLKLKAKYNSFWCGFFLSFLDTKARVYIKQLKFKIFILWFLILFEMQTMNKRNFLFCVANVKVFLLDNIEQNSSTTLVS